MSNIEATEIWHFATRTDVPSAGFDWIRSAPAMIHSLGADGRIRQVSELWLSKLGYKLEEVIGAKAVDFLVQSSRSNFALPSLFETGRCNNVELALLHKSGDTMDVLVSALVVEDAAGIPSTLSFVTDISAQKAAERMLIESEARYRLLAEQALDMMFQVDENPVWKYASPACREIAGYDPEKLVGKPAFQHLHSDEAERVRQRFGEVASGHEQHGSLSYRILHSEDRWIWVESRFRGTRDPVTGRPTGLIGTLRDVSAKMEVEEKLAEANRKLKLLASRDGLTELYNRRAFDEIFAREIEISARESTTLTVLMIDVDCFKAYNDRYGHPAGDAALRHVSAAIRSSARCPADVAARYGGEEFIVLLPDTDEQGGMAVATAIRTSVESLQLSHEISPHRVLTVSVGVATGSNFLQGNPSKEVLLSQADTALYSAKNAGRNTTVLWTPFRDLVFEYIDLLTEIISQDNSDSFDIIDYLVDEYIVLSDRIALNENSGGGAHLLEAIISNSLSNRISDRAYEIIRQKLSRHTTIANSLKKPNINTMHLINNR